MKENEKETDVKLRVKGKVDQVRGKREARNGQYGIDLQVFFRNGYELKFIVKFCFFFFLKNFCLLREKNSKR